MSQATEERLQDSINQGNQEGFNSLVESLINDNIIDGRFLERVEKDLNANSVENLLDEVRDNCAYYNDIHKKNLRKLVKQFAQSKSDKQPSTKHYKAKTKDKSLSNYKELNPKRKKSSKSPNHSKDTILIIYDEKKERADVLSLFSTKFSINRIY